MTETPEPNIVTVGGYFSVQATTYREHQFDVAGLTTEEIADHLDSLAEQPFICHACSHDVQGAELDEITALVIDGQEFTHGDDGWKASGP